MVSYAEKYEKFTMIEQIVKQYGLVIFWLRLSNVMPYNVFNYFVGLTSVRLIDYVIAHLGMIPGIALFCFIGGSVAEIIDIVETGITNNIAFVTVFIITLVISIIAIILISYCAKKKWDSMVESINNRGKLDSDAEIASEMQIMNTATTSSSAEYLRV